MKLILNDSCETGNSKLTLLLIRVNILSTSLINFVWKYCSSEVDSGRAVDWSSPSDPSRLQSSETYTFCCFWYPAFVCVCAKRTMDLNLIRLSWILDNKIVNQLKIRNSTFETNVRVCRKYSVWKRTNEMRSTRCSSQGTPPRRGARQVAR